MSPFDVLFALMLPWTIQTGLASVYTDSAVSCRGEVYSARAMAAAHRTLPCGAMAKVTNLANGHSVVVRIIDRGPCADPPSPLCIRLGLERMRLRIIDLTPSAAARVGIDGIGRVQVERVS